jgi:hypothetical protein
MYVCYCASVSPDPNARSPATSELIVSSRLISDLSSLNTELSSLAAQYRNRVGLTIGGGGQSTAAAFGTIAAR